MSLHGAVGLSNGCYTYVDTSGGEEFVLRSVKSAPALRSSTETRDFVVFDRKLVIIRNLLVDGNIAFGIDNDLLL